MFSRFFHSNLIIKHFRRKWADEPEKNIGPAGEEGRKSRRFPPDRGKDKEKPLPGDLVSISVLDETEKKGNLDEILP